jgi:hypothetical protein
VIRAWLQLRLKARPGHEKLVEGRGLDRTGFVKGNNRMNNTDKKLTGFGIMARAFVRAQRVLFVFTLALLAWCLPLNAKEKVMECAIKNGQVVDRSGKPLQNCMFVSGGKTYMVMNGKAMLMTKNMTMSDGTQCMADGTCVMKNGKKMKLKEGEGVDTSNGQYFRVRGLLPPGSFSKP